MSNQRQSKTDEEWEALENRILNKTIMISKEDAIQILLKGGEVKHTSFKKGESITMHENNIIMGNHKESAGQFWKSRVHHNWNHGWSDLNDKTK